MRIHNLLIVIILVTFATTACEDNDKFISPSVDGLTMDIEVGGPSQPNQAFVNLHTGTQIKKARNDWDLGFYSGGEFRVVINGTSKALVKKLDKKDLTLVTSEDTVGLGAMLSYDAIFNAVVSQPPPAWVSESVNWVDDPAGNISLTAIDEISVSDESNNVYIINRGENPDGTPRGWMKFRVLQESGSYVVQFALIASTSFNSLAVPKNANFNFNYFNFDNDIIEVEPGKSDWDISFTTYFEILNFGVNFPYHVKDFVLLNRNEVDVSEIVISTDQTLEMVYEDFTREDVNTLTFSSEIISIGSKWRTVASPTPGSVTAVKSDRFYIIRNGNGNYFKLIFTAMLNSSGERGYPQIKYQLLQ